MQHFKTYRSKSYEANVDEAENLKSLRQTNVSAHESTKSTLSVVLEEDENDENRDTMVAPAKV